MPWGWECRARLVKQLPSKPTERRAKEELKSPGPQHYEAPPVFGGKGYSGIQRAPAYTFGHRTAVSFSKQLLTPKALILDISGHSRTGRYRIRHGVVSPQLECPRGKDRVPGPDRYAPRSQLAYKRPPAYSLRPAAKPPSQPGNMWTPPPNMYWPYVPLKKPPAYTLGRAAREPAGEALPGPGQHEPNFGFVEQSQPAYSFGAPFRSLPCEQTPPPNTYCHKRFMYPKRSVPSPSFGIRHSPFAGRQDEYLKPSNL